MVDSCFVIRENIKINITIIWGSAIQIFLCKKPFYYLDILFLHLTSHLGDSGMKKSPTSRTAQGTNPA